MQKQTSILYCALALTSLASVSHAQSTVEECVMQAYSNGDDRLTLAEIRQTCSGTTTNVEEAEVAKLRITPDSAGLVGAISSRIVKERQTEFEPYVITPHKMNYILPAVTTNAINKEAYSTFEGYEDNLEDIEAKFQLSIKVPLNYDSIFIEGDGLYFGFTIQAWWQIYAENISKPFRETNYQPELFYLAPLDWHPFGGNTGFVVGIEHQSNGRAQNLSRSWNRVYTNFLFEKDNFALSFKPWTRLSEDEKEFEFDPNGDDNPDIDDFLGRHELGMVYKWNDLEFSFGSRYSFSTSKGSAEFGLTFPLWGKLRGYATAFNGYGESLIDYNYSQTRFGLGIALNNVL
ncbi:phospholipase A [uncultured Paraglaciecola sp.]|uniref:phospholipase A n=1 Tax=uncultured Paraglaciecola sp. TaxID=1765024 RepID=UPI0025956983|nr:phospholipase A [uncultured Paraglaciecola sp.]